MYNLNCHTIRLTDDRWLHGCLQQMMDTDGYINKTNKLNMQNNGSISNQNCVIWWCRVTSKTPLASEKSAPQFYFRYTLILKCWKSVPQFYFRYTLVLKCWKLWPNNARACQKRMHEYTHFYGCIVYTTKRHTKTKTIYFFKYSI